MKEEQRRREINSNARSNSKVLKSSLLFFVLYCALYQVALADQITLKNGDRLTGTITKVDAAKLSIKTEFAGEIDVQLAAVDSITSDAPVYVTSKDGRVIVGTLKTVDGRIEIQTADVEKVTLAKEDIQLLRSQAEQALYEAAIEKQNRASYVGSLDAGLSLTRGNSDTIIASIGTQSARTTQKDKLSLFAAGLFARNNTTGISVTTAEAIRGGVRYDRNISDRLFGFALTDLERDRFQQLDLRLVLGGGLGFHARRTERTRLDLFAGGSFNQEFFSTGLRRKSAEALIGNELTYKLSDFVTIGERAVFYPNISDFGEYRLTFDSSAAVRLSRRLSLQVTLSDRFLSNPPPGLKKNDLLLTTGIRATFGNVVEKK